MSDGDASVACQEVVAFFDRRNPDGTHFYSDEDVRAFLPLLVIRYGLDYQSSAPLRKVMEEFSENANILPGQKPGEVEGNLKAYLAARPIIAVIARDFEEYCAALIQKRQAPAP